MDNRAYLASEPFREAGLRQVGQFLFIPPKWVEALARLRTARIVSGPSSNGHGYRSEPFGWELFTTLSGRVDVGDPIELSCWSGLRAVVLRLIAEAGHPVVDLGPPLAPLPAPNYALLGKEMDRLDTPFLQLIQRCDRALIRHHPTAVDPSRLIAQVALAWPGLSITVAVKRINEAYRMRRQLRLLDPDVECYHTITTPRSRGVWRSPRMTISTTARSNWPGVKSSSSSTRARE